MEIELRIDTFALESFPQIDFDRMAASFRAELTRLIDERGIPEALRKSWSKESIRLDPPMLPRGISPEVIGLHLAQSLYERLQAPPNEAVPSQR
jgi:hypothetical protein